MSLLFQLGMLIGDIDCFIYSVRMLNHVTYYFISIPFITLVTNLNDHGD